MSKVPQQLNRRRIAILGGTFDPIHNGHLHLIDTVIKNIELDEVWLMPNAIPPHRPAPLLDAQTRVALCKAAAEGYANVIVKCTELDLPPPSYTLHTLRFLHEHEQPDAHFLWILGADAWRGFDRWFQWESVLRLANWLVLERPGSSCHPEKDSPLWPLWEQRQNIQVLNEKNAWSQWGGGVFTFPIAPYPASSTAIRDAWKKGELADVRKWLPPAVWKRLNQSKEKI